ncbi:MAG: outer membrane beta-barrel protein [Hyphomicrobiaceae bacterium]|nr:outer membrane beta-barrel protein [Hyphomicrobiaceae bacterium]
MVISATGALAGGPCGGMKDDCRGPAYSWTGLYGGVQFGYGFGDVSAKSGPFPGAFDQTYSYDTQGVLGGLRLGYNMQTGNVVFGVEADIEKADVNQDGVGSLGYLHRMNLNTLGSVRGRLGVASGSWLFYGTGGWAWGRNDLTKAVTPASAPFASVSQNRSGWTAGLGVENAISRNSTISLEYRYTDFGSTRFESSAANSQDESKLTFGAVRLGYNVRF